MTIKRSEPSIAIPSTAQQNILLVRKLFEEAYNRYNLAILDQIMANNVKLHDPASPKHNEGLEAIKELETTYTKAFPNKKIKIDDIRAIENIVIVRWTCVGIHTGALQGIEPANKAFTINGISIYQITNGKITEIWQNWDRLGLLEQIGEIAPALALHY